MQNDLDVCSPTEGTNKGTHQSYYEWCIIYRTSPRILNSQRASRPNTAAIVNSTLEWKRGMLELAEGKVNEVRVHHIVRLSDCRGERRDFTISPQVVVSYRSPGLWTSVVLCGGRRKQDRNGSSGLRNLGTPSVNGNGGPSCNVGQIYSRAIHDGVVIHSSHMHFRKS